MALFLCEEFQELLDVFLSEGDVFSVVDDEAGDAHDLVFLLQIREMVEVIDLGGDVCVFSGDALGGGHQFRAHGAG